METVEGLIGSINMWQGQGMTATKKSSNEGQKSYSRAMSIQNKHRIFVGLTYEYTKYIHCGAYCFYCQGRFHELKFMRILNKILMY